MDRKMITPKYKLIAAALLSVALITGAYFKGRSDVNQAWDKEKLIQEAKIKDLEAKSAEVTVQIVTEYVYKDRIIKEKGDQIVKYVDKYITAEQDSACVLGNNIIRLHDAAANNEVPDTAGLTDESPSEVKISEYSGTVAENYNTCYRVSNQLEHLIEWVQEQRAVK